MGQPRHPWRNTELKSYTTDIVNVSLLNHDVYRVRLRVADAQHRLEFIAGQYLDLELPDGRKASFSIASAPDQSSDLELHIRAMPESLLNTAILTHLQTQPQVSVTLGMGSCCLDVQTLNPEQHLVFVAASTGFAQIKSMVEHLLANQVMNPIDIYWGARQREDMYLVDLPDQWSKEHKNVRFVPVLSDDDAEWMGRKGMLPTAIQEDLPSDLSQMRVYISGSPAMVYALVDVLEDRGVLDDQIFADAFAYAPRPVRHT
ncbi:NAD(P)H-flavin reductase [Nitrincola tibetensis]|uniref:NAD(P)H-flavin reductase n=1 Tax=Nitrincola tibetensis TaxID=2219697 RepID=A0A364NIG9_9GAMM|nr:NAD(P)H-flavin reductase [Nitrincola tibetensis]